MRGVFSVQDYLYEKDTRVVTYQDFVNKELVLFSNEDNERSIPSLVDGTIFNILNFLRKYSLYILLENSTRLNLQ